MKYNKKRHKKIKYYQKVKSYEYALIFDNSNSLIEYVCNKNCNNIINSSLYTKDKSYQLIVISTMAHNFDKNIVFKDKLHIEEIKLNCHLVCKNNVIEKIQKAFKAI